MRAVVLSDDRPKDFSQEPWCDIAGYIFLTFHLYSCIACDAVSFKFQAFTLEWKFYKSLELANLTYAV